MANDMASEERQAIGQMIFDHFAGKKLGDVSKILGDVLGTHAGGIAHWTGRDVAYAEAIIDELANYAKAHARQHWGEIYLGNAAPIGEPQGRA